MEPDRKVRLLIVEDDVNLGYLLVENLVANKIEVTLVGDGRLALRELSSARFDLCVFDVMLPEIDGFTLAAQVRDSYPNLPFLFLTARGQEKDKLRGFEAGADDYITKPFSFKEFFYRVNVILRRINIVVPAATKKMFHYGETTLWYSKRVLSVKGNERKLSQREAELLSVLMCNKGIYVSRGEILTRVWGRDDYFAAKSMDVYMTRLRKLLKDDITIGIGKSLWIRL